ncbi:MAG TPA: signal peptidase I [Phycisphaerales bacterium]|nr:signal peptidase I [Phycisphaerales bacterium]
MPTLNKDKGTKAAGPKRGLLDRIVREWIVPIGLVMAIMAPIRSVIADWNDVPSGSMRPTILEGDRIYVNKLAFGLRVPFTTSWIAQWSTPRRGDIVTFASPADGIRLVKRVVGVPGDHISLSHNRLYINGVEADTSVTDDHASSPLPNGAHVPVVLKTENLLGVEHAITITPGLSSFSTFPEVVVPEGHYFVMGDNRDQSNDSRYIGMVPLSSIYGRCSGVAMSLNPEQSYAPRWDRWLSPLR